MGVARDGNLGSLSGREIVVVVVVVHFLRLLWSASPRNIVISWKSEFRGMERTDVIRTTRSTLWYKPFGLDRRFRGWNGLAEAK